jgi:transposase
MFVKFAKRGILCLLAEGHRTRRQGMSKRAKKEFLEVMGKRRWREEEAQKVMSAWRGSGETVWAFARGNGLVAQRLYRWARRLKGGESPEGFHPVRLLGVSGAVEGRKIEIELMDGRRVRVGEGFSAEELGRVLEVLEGRG